MFSRRAVDTIVQSGVICPSDEYADDMFIGMISMLRLQIKLVHSPLFHQVSKLGEVATMNEIRVIESTIRLIPLLPAG